MNQTIHSAITDVTNKQWVFKDLRSLEILANAEVSYWENASKESESKPTHIYYSGLEHWKKLLAGIEAKGEEIKSWSDEQAQDYVDKLKHDMFNNIQAQWLWSGHSYTKAFVDCQSKFGHKAAGSFILFVVNGHLDNNGQKDGFIGSMLAYEYELQDTDLVKRRKTEKASISILRGQLERATDAFKHDIKKTSQDFDEWSLGTIEKWNGWHSNTLDEHVKALDTQQDKHEAQILSQGAEIDALIVANKIEMTNMESLFREHLRLEAPATYWKTSANKLQKQGIMWVFLLVASVVAGIICLSSFFNTWLLGQEVTLKLGLEGDIVKLNTLQGTFIFGALIAGFSYLVRTFSRLAFSSFHLMRDAEEREQLTYLYLSLSSEKKVDETSRDIILQALFSRSDTGLLKGDTGPTMPASDLLKTFVRSK